MSINADKPHLWKADIAASVDLFNTWFLEFAPRAYRETRLQTTKQVEELLLLTHDLTAITPQVLKERLCAGICTNPHFNEVGRSNGP